MLINNTIVMKGFFFTPDKPNEKHPGILTISEGGKAELEITSTMPPFPSSMHNSIGRLIGEVAKGFVTLEDCSYRSISLSIGTPERSLINCNTVFDGVGFIDTPYFSSLKFCIDGLNEWRGSSAFRINHSERFEDTSITINMPDAVSFTLPDGSTFEISFDMKIPGRAASPKIELSQQAFIKVKSLRPEPFTYYQRLSHRLTRFFCFVIGRTVAIHSLEATTNLEGQLEAEHRVNIYFRTLNGVKKEDFSRVDMLLEHSVLASRFESLLVNWLKNYENLEPALHHHYSVQDNGYQYADTKFLAIAQAIEALHRRTSVTSKMPQEKFKEKMEAILAGCPEEDREWLANRLTYGNEITLADRLNLLIEPFGAVLGSKTLARRIVRGTVDTRNYHAHYDSKGEKKALKGARLVALTYRLRVLFTLNLLVHLGYSVEDVVTIAKSPHLSSMLLTASSIDSSKSVRRKKD